MTVSTRLHIVQVVCTRRHAGVENYVGRISGELARRGHRVTVITCLPSSLFVPDGVEAMDVSNWREAARMLRTLEHIDIVNSHMTEADTASVWALRNTKTPIVSTRHFAKRRWSKDDGQGSTLLRLHPLTRKLPPGPLLRTLRHMVDRRIDIELAIGEYVGASMGRCDRIILSGVDVQQTVPTADERSKRVVLLQRLEPVKSTRIALDAWEKSVARFHGWTLEIHGEGSELSMLASEIRRRRLDDSVSMMGWCSDVPSLLRSVGVLLAPARHEPLGLTVLEAMSFGVPVVACASGGHLETVGSASEAQLFPEGDSGTCASLIDRLISNSDLRQRVADSQRSRQVSHLSLRTMIDQLEELYFEAIDRNL